MLPPKSMTAERREILRPKLHSRPEHKDGLYRVTTKYLCAGFVIEKGKVTMCAPILRKRLAYWRTVAVKISD